MLRRRVEHGVGKIGEGKEGEVFSGVPWSTILVRYNRSAFVPYNLLHMNRELWGSLLMSQASLSSSARGVAGG